MSALNSMQGTAINIDLHCHSTASDGSLPPDELVERAAQQGVTALAITDHDTVQAYASLLPTAAALPLQLITGVELSCVWQGMLIHVVGLDLDLQNSVLMAGLQQQAHARSQRAVVIAERLGKRGLGDDLYGAAAALADSPESIGRPHFARVLVERGLVRNMDAAFDKYLGAGKIGDVKLHWPELAEVVAWIRAAGGIPVVAHPLKYKMTRQKLRRLLAAFVEVGGQAMEVAGCNQQPADVTYLARTANEFGLWASRGSDFHGPSMPWSDLGRAASLPSDCEPVWRHFKTPLGE